MIHHSAAIKSSAPSFGWYSAGIPGAIGSTKCTLQNIVRFKARAKAGKRYPAPPKPRVSATRLRNLSLNILDNSRVIGSSSSCIPTAVSDGGLALDGDGGFHLPPLHMMKCNDTAIVCQSSPGDNSSAVPYASQSSAISMRNGRVLRQRYNSKSRSRVRMSPVFSSSAS